LGHDLSFHILSNLLLTNHTSIIRLYVILAIESFFNKQITKLCRQQAEVIQNHESEHVRGIGQGEARHRKYKRLKFGGCQAYDRSSD
jgi:hypothetical protein